MSQADQLAPWQPLRVTVSVVVPNYNHAKYLRQRIETVLTQTYQNFEVILLDDCSTDDSRTVIEEYRSHSKVRIEYNDKNSGSTFKQWNKGARMARGKYIWFAESDDYADPQLLETLVPRLDNDPEAVLAYCRSWRVSADGTLDGHLDSYLAWLDSQRWTQDFRAEGVSECEQYLIRCNTVLSASSVVFRKEAYWNAGGADETLTLCGDWKVWAAMALNHGTISYAGETPMNYYRVHDSSVTERSVGDGRAAAETLFVVKWILSGIQASRKLRRELGEQLSALWVPAVFDRAVPKERKWAILRSAISIDRWAIYRLAKPGGTALRLSIARRWRAVRARLRSFVTTQ